MKTLYLGVLLLSVGGSTFGNIHDMLISVEEGYDLNGTERDTPMPIPSSVLAGLRILVEEEQQREHPQLQHPVSPPYSPNSSIDHPVPTPTRGVTLPGLPSFHPVSPPERSSYLRSYSPLSSWTRSRSSSRFRSGSNSSVDSCCFFEKNR